MEKPQCKVLDIMESTECANSTEQVGPHMLVSSSLRGKWLVTPFPFAMTRKNRPHKALSTWKMDSKINGLLISYTYRAGEAVPIGLK